MTTTVNSSVDQAAPWEDRTRPVVVGVDGSWRNRAAIDWAADQAVATHRQLDLVAVLRPYDGGSPHGRERPVQPQDWSVLDDLAANLSRSRPELVVRRVLSVGGAAPSLLTRAAEAAALVVGRRGQGGVIRTLLGSTSAEVAGHARVPVVVVPDVLGDPGEQAPVVVGISPWAPHGSALRYAFQAARQRETGLTVVHGFELPMLLAWEPVVEPKAYDELAHDALAELHQIVETAQSLFPDVAVRIEQVHGNPVDVLLDAAKSSPLLVVGRDGGRADGFGWGSVARAVVHHAKTPVAIVPHPAVTSISDDLTGLADSEAR